MDSTLGEFTNGKFGQGVGEKYFGPEIGMSYVLNKANSDARFQFELGKRFGEMILSKCY